MSKRKITSWGIQLVCWGVLLLPRLSTAHTQPNCQALLSSSKITAPAIHELQPGKVVEKRTRLRQLRRTQTTYRLTHGVFEGLGPHSKGMQMAFDYRVATKLPRELDRGEKPVFLTIHGVGDSRDDLNGLTGALEKRGASILRVDTLGHGQTASLSANQTDPDQIIDYRSDVELIASLVRTLGIKKVVIIGHSKGGGLSMDITRELRNSGVEVAANIPIAPYLSAIDKWFLSHALAQDPALFRERADALAEKWGLQRHQVFENATSLLGPAGRMLALSYTKFQDYWKTVITIRRDMRLRVADLALNSSLAEVTSELSDPIVKAMMHKMYTKYLNLKNEKLSPSRRKSPEQIELLVKGAIASTIGIRDLDFQNRRNPTPLDHSVPTLVITGRDDQVVTPAQVHDYKEFIESQGYQNFNFVEFEYDHFIPQRDPEGVVKTVMEFLASLRP